jgi:hypothetical protein
MPDPYWQWDWFLLNFLMMPVVWAVYAIMVRREKKHKDKRK